MPKTLDHSVDIAAPAGPGLGPGFHNRGSVRLVRGLTIVPGPQGSVTLRFAPGAEATVPILVWDPPRRIRFGILDGGRVHDIAVTATAAGSRVLLQDEGVPDAEADSAAAGWAGFLGKLRVLAETGGQPQAATAT